MKNQPNSLMQNAKHNIATVINYCTTEYRFIKKCIDSASIFSSQVLVVVCSSFYDGEPENRYLLNKTYEENHRASFIEFEYDKDMFEQNGTHFPHNLARWIGYKFLDEKVEYVLFLDADEIVVGDLFKRWLDTFAYKNLDAMTFRSYWYFRMPTYRARQTEAQGVLIRRGSVTKKIMFHVTERRAMLPASLSSVTICGEGEPLVHHYSWVRTKKEMLKKVSSWGHRHDQKWTALVEEEFARPIPGRDFVHGYDYDIVDPYFDTAMCDYPTDSNISIKEFINRTYLPKKDVRAILPVSIICGFLPDISIIAVIKRAIRRIPILGGYLQSLKTIFLGKQGY